ncbi:unnamed protein product [Merluccius merluccius]
MLDWVTPVPGQVQSALQVRRDEAKRFVFELMMTNGKRKLLAAETAALRTAWLGQLWRAMHLCHQASSQLGSPRCSSQEGREPRYTSSASPSSEEMNGHKADDQRTSPPAQHNQEMTESIYDVPSSLLRTVAAQTVGKIAATAS